MGVGNAVRSNARRWAAAAVAAGGLGLSLSANAYVSPTPPPGFGGTPGNWTYAPPSPAEQVGKIMRGPGPSVAGSGPTTAAYRLGGGAARALARGVIGGGIAGIAIAGAAWLLENCFKKDGAQWVRTCGAGVPQEVQADMYMWHGNQNCADGPDKAAVALQNFKRTYLASCTAPDPANLSCNVTTNTATAYAISCTFTNQFGNPASGSGASTRTSTLYCPQGWYITPAGCTQTAQPVTVTPQQVEDEMAEKPLPEQLPPGFPYPLDPTSPTIWNPDTANPPNPQPMRVPQGNPVPVPNTNPQQYRQPMVRVEHAPTITDPWRMDERTEETTGTSPTGQTGPETIGGESPPATPTEEDKRDLCEKNPDILACSKPELDVPEGEIPKDTKTITYQAESPFGGGSCPADKYVSSGLAGKSFKAVDWGQWCSYGASYIRPLIILLATISAFFIVAIARDAE